MKARAVLALCLVAGALLGACAVPATATPGAVPATAAATAAGGEAGACLPSEEACAPNTTPGAAPSATPEATSPAAATATLPPTPAPTATQTPPAAPGLDLIAFESERDGNAEVYLLDAATGALTNLSRHPADDRAPAWRPDGGAIAFASHRDGNWEIYCLDLATGRLARLTEDLAYDGAPAWSPDGQRVTFETTRDGNLEVYAMAADGSDPVRLTEDEAGDYGPAWSPDGESIAFTSWRDGNKEIYLVPAGGGEARNLTNSPADEEDPAWRAPEGDAIALVSWREGEEGGRRDADIHDLYPARAMPGGPVTSEPWPDVDPASDAGGRLVWASYDPGPAFETYDPYRPGDYHLYRLTAAGTERLTEGAWDDRRPAPAPAQVVDLAGLAARLPPLPAPPTPEPAPEAGRLAEVVEVPSILAGKGGPPILVNERVLPSLVAWQQDVRAATGYDFLRETLGSWRNVDSVRKKAMYAYDYGFLSWHKTGRALDLALELKVDGADQLLLVREDLGESTFWRLYLRTAAQDGSQGEPLKENPWLRWWWIVPSEDPEAYAAGGRRLPVPAGYYVDLTALAKRHGWERIASYAIEGDYHWLTDTNGTEYWHYERTDGLTWWEAMRQIYAPETLEKNVGWAVGLKQAQTVEMMRSKGVPEPAP